MARIRKWSAGYPIRTMDEFAKAIDDRRYIFEMGHGYHYGWAMSWRFVYVKRLIAQARLFHGERNPDYPYVFRVFWCEHAVDSRKSVYWGTCDDLPYKPDQIESKTERGISILARRAIREFTGRLDFKIKLNYQSRRPCAGS